MNMDVERSYLNEAFVQQIEDDKVESSWNEANENLVIYMALKTKMMMKKHAIMFEKTNRIHKILMYPTIGLSTISGVINYNDQHILTRYITSGVSIITAILLSYVKFMKLGELIESHSRTSTLYHLLYRKIIQELLREPRERKYANEFIEMINNEFDDLIKISPSIPENIRIKAHTSYNQWAITNLRSSTARPSRTIMYRAFYKWRKLALVKSIVENDIDGRISWAGMENKTFKSSSSFGSTPTNRTSVKDLQTRPSLEIISQDEGK